jgi:hypothetical protein
MVGRQRFKWSATGPLDKAVSRDGVRAFRRYARAAAPLFSPELKALGGGGAQAANPPEDYLFCALATAAGAAGGPGGAIIVGGLCGWFMSNGID